MSPPDPILHDIPEWYESERLIIRPPQAGDGPAVYEAIEESLTELEPWMPWVHEERSIDVSEAHARQAHADFLARRDLPLFLFARDDGRFVGGSGLHRIVWEVPMFEIGYWIRTSLTGRGFATEATRRIAHVAFEDLGAERVEIWCDARNDRSAAVARAAGFELEARLRRHRRAIDGSLADSLCFARLRAPANDEDEPPV